MTDREIEALVRDHGDAALAFLRYRARDADLAEDLLADTLERVYRARRRFDVRRGSQRTWLLSIALNVWRDHARRTATERAAVERFAEEGHAGPVTQDPDGREDRMVLLGALDQLPDAEQEVVALVYGADLKAKQVATLLGVPVTTVNGRLHRGLRRLNDLLG